MSARLKGRRKIMGRGGKSHLRFEKVNRKMMVVKWRKGSNRIIPQSWPAGAVNKEIDPN
jgi:hypothetical protein